MRCTREQLLAAEAAYNVHAAEHGFPIVMLVPLEPALDAALALVPEPVELESVLDAGTLDRSAALVRAQEMVDKLSTVPMKSNGYAVDGWKAPSLEERTTQILRLAAFMTGTAGEV